MPAILLFEEWSMCFNLSECLGVCLKDLITGTIRIEESQTILIPECDKLWEG